MKCGCDPHIEYCDICFPLKDRKASVDFRSRGEVLITSDGETHVFHRELPTRKPLTDEQIDAEFDRECWVTVVFADGTRGIALDRVTAKDFARAIERAHGITND